MNIIKPYEEINKKYLIQKCFEVHYQGIEAELDTGLKKHLGDPGKKNMNHKTHNSFTPLFGMIYKEKYLFNFYEKFSYFDYSDCLVI